MRNITESFHCYKNWDFKIRCVENNGIWSTIFKDVPNIKSPNGLKRLPLRQKGWEYMDIDKLIQQTKDFIDNHESNLFQSLEFQKKKHNIYDTQTNN
jgi:hypothetical protein